MTVSVPTHDEVADLIAMVQRFADENLAPVASQWEATETFPREALRRLGDLGVLSLTFPQETGFGVPFSVYLQVLEELAARWVTVALAVSVHALACHPLLSFGRAGQVDHLLPNLADGRYLGAYCLSEVHAGSDPAAMQTRAIRIEGGWRLAGTKAWVTHGGVADFYTIFARTADDARGGISCFHVPADRIGLEPGRPEEKMGLTGSPTTLLHLRDLEVLDAELIGEQGQGLGIALSALDAGRLGIAAIAVGLSQAALTYATRYARERQSFGHAIMDYQGVAFLLADMDAQTQAARDTYRAAAHRKDFGQPYAREASIAKLIATDTAMRVTTDAVQVLGGAGYVRDHPLERYMREAKVMQIFEGTNQIQRLVIARHLEKSCPT